MHGFVENKDIKIEDIDHALAEPTDRRIFVIAKAMARGYDVERIHALTKIDRWFLYKLRAIMDTADELGAYNQPEDLPEDLLRLAKQQGFSDFQIARSVYKDDMSHAHESGAH